MKTTSIRCLICLIVALVCIWPFPTVPSVSANYFQQATPIWVHNHQPLPHEVALFRYELNLRTAVPTVTLSIFADTRYEAYLNGQLIGRGPARFSRYRREYDKLVIGELLAGRHVLSVRVQWAPNNRRSESDRPFLWALLESSDQILAASGPHWQAQLLTAYRSDAAPVHRWGLIGPTEIVDLALLPPDWTIRGGVEPWRSATPVAVQPVLFEQRSIPLLSEVEIPFTVTGIGWLGRELVPIEFPGNVEQPTVPLQITRHTIATLVGLDDALTRQVTINGQPLVWQPATGRPAGIITAHYPLRPGTHILRLSNLRTQPDGWTLFISRDGLANIPPLIFSNHAGRRVLLPSPLPDPQAVTLVDQPFQTALFQPRGSYLVLDLGRTVHGRLIVEVRGPTGSIIDIGWDERLWHNMVPLPFPGTLHPEWNQVDSWKLDGRSQIISTIDARAGRYIIIVVWSEEPVELHNLRVYEERYPVNQVGAFTSNDPLLNHVWRVGVNSVLPNMTDAYTDTPWRERGQWWGDAYVTDHINQVVFGDHLLRRRGLRQLGDDFTVDGIPAAIAPNPGPNRMLDYGMLWVQAIADDLRLSDDPTLARELWPTLDRFLNHLSTYRNSYSGLLDLPRGPWQQTTYLDTSAWSARYGQSTPVNAMYYGTLRAAASIADALGQTDAANRWNSEATMLRDRINHYLYDQTTRRYITTITDGQIIKPGPHAQALALAYDVVPESEIQAVANALLSLIVHDPTRANLQLYGMFWTLKGLSRAGRINDALTLIRHFYGWQLDRGATTWWEHLSADQLWTASLSHSWSGSPTWFLSTVILGARQTGPTTWEVEPSWQGVQTVTGTIPLLSGSLHVSWEQTRCELRQVTIQSPSHTRGILWLPPPTPSTVITLNGIEIWSSSGRSSMVEQHDDGRIRVVLEGSNSYSVEQQQTCLTTWLPAIHYQP